MAVSVAEAILMGLVSLAFFLFSFLVVFSAYKGSVEGEGKRSGSDASASCVVTDGRACVYLKENQCMPKDWGTQIISTVSQTMSSKNVFDRVFGTSPEISNPLKDRFDYDAVTITDQDYLDLFNSINTSIPIDKIMLQIAYDSTETLTGSYSVVQGDFDYQELQAVCQPNNTCKDVYHATVVTLRLNTVNVVTGTELCANTAPGSPIFSG
ncbi:MAG: hypothetical protein K0U52_08390 [Gammaproteobacteria bacterium]|nr:hypothetical protein [Gammaproteobacteria bacterium]